MPLTRRGDPIYFGTVEGIQFRVHETSAEVSMYAWARVTRQALLQLELGHNLGQTHVRTVYPGKNCYHLGQELRKSTP